MRLVVATCTVQYTGRLTSHLPLAKRVLMLKSDGSILVHSDGGSYKPLNWMSPPAALVEAEPTEEQADAGATKVWTVTHKKTGDALTVQVHEIESDASFELGTDPGLVKDGVEAHLQELLADQIQTLGEGFELFRREYMTAIGPVDILARDGDGATVAIEIKRRGEIDGVEQLTRYLELLNRDPRFAPVSGVFAAQEIKPQARTLAEDRGIRCVVLDYEELRGIESNIPRLF